MKYFLIPAKNKPNRIETPETEKDEQYHATYARWVISAAGSKEHQDYIRNYELNRNFYTNKQWILPEDLEAFFKDEAGQDRNRIKVTRNYIQPMVEQYRGNAERMTFDMKVTNLSPLARSRRERILYRLLLYNDVARNMTGFKDYMARNNIPVGEETELEDKFSNMYVDQHIISMNRLLRYSKNVNKLDEYRTSLAIDTALAGINIMKPYPYAGEWMFKRIPPNRFGWDRSAIDPCLTDAEFFWEEDLLPLSTIVEQWQNLSLDIRKTLERFIISGSGPIAIDAAAAGKIPVFHAVWRDILVDIFGYVTDEFGQRILVRLNYIEEGQKKPKYTYKDVIPVEQLTAHQKQVVKGSNTVALYVDNWRTCSLIPVEIVGTPIGGGQAKDIVLEFGTLPYQEPDLYRPTNMTPPYKVGTWSYVDGMVLSPVDVVINPQRMINRFLSVMENQINNSGGAGIVYDKDLTGAIPEDEIIAKVGRGESIGVTAKGRGVQNVFGRYDATPKESIIAFSTLIDSFKLGIEQVTGVNEGIKGETNNPDQLVGVMQLMIQRGSIIQEPFYKALMDTFRGCYQSIITSGKRYYIDNDVELIDAVGEESANVLKLSKDIRNESMRVTLIRSIDIANERLMVDTLLLTWLQFGIIDQEMYSKLVGKATNEEALLEMREFQKRLAVQKRMAAITQQQLLAQGINAQQQANEVVYNEGVRDTVREDLNKEKDRQTKLDVATVKSQK